MNEVDLRLLCTITQGTAHQHMPPWANLTANPVRSIVRNAGNLAGPGIYACFWDGALIYIGSYSGISSDPFGGHVIERAYKHIVGFTLRSDRLFFKNGPLRNIVGRLDHPIARDLEQASQRGSRVYSEGGADNALGANGAICATENKANFASRHWDVLRDAKPEDLFDHIGFAYRRIAPPEGILSKKIIKDSWIEAIENRLIATFEPTCNTKGRRGPDGIPATLEQVSQELDVATTEVLAKLMPLSLADA